jgi:hypothetical protein
MQATQKLFLIAWSAVVIIVIALMVLLYTSLLPHFTEIGDWLVWVVRLGMVCASCLMVAFTWFKIISMHHYSQFVRHGEVVSYIGKNKPTVVSAEHEQAKVPRLLPAPKDEPLFEPDEQDIINIYNANQSITLQELADKFGMKYHQVQKIYSEAKKSGLITR